MAAKKSKGKSAKAAMEAKRFFQVVVPRILPVKPATGGDLGGRYAVDVEGHGAWTLDFPSASVVAGRDDADVTVFLNVEQFASLSSASVELAKLVADKTVRTEGDAS